MQDTFGVVVVGAGPAGMMAAHRAALVLRGHSNAKEVALFEKNASVGRKLGLTGRGRCNVTNDSSLDDFLASFGKNGVFLRDAFKSFFVQDLLHFFQERGVTFKRERQGRMFPESDSSRSIVEAMKGALKEAGVKIFLSSPVEDVVEAAGEVRGIRLKGGREVPAEAVILAAGGASYPETGSTGDGYRIAEKLRHGLRALHPGLVPLETGEDFVRDLQGLVLKNVRIVFRASRREISSDVGELLFTHFGISGPLVLDLSGRVCELLASEGRVSAQIDLKPGLTGEDLGIKLQKEFREHGSRMIKNYLEDILPRNFVAAFLGAAGIDGEIFCSRISAPQRSRIAAFLKRFPLSVKKPRPISEAMVTCGGVSLEDIDPRTMMSRRVKGFYFCGEVLDVAARSGGYNLQAAFSTGYLAGESAARRLVQTWA